MTEKKSEKNGPALSFRPTDRIAKLLEEAQRVTGSDRSALISSCIEQAIDEVMKRDVEARLKEARAAAERLKAAKKK